MEETINVKITVNAPTKQTRGYAKRVYFIGKWDALKRSGREMGYQEFKEVIEFLAPLVSIEGKPDGVDNETFLWDIASEENFDQIFAALKGEAATPIPPQQNESSATL